jgi:serine/threonine protein kinase
MPDSKPQAGVDLSLLCFYDADMRCAHCEEELSQDFAFCPSCGQEIPKVERSLVLGGRYQLKQKIGAGGYGTVYEAQDLKDPRRVAVKLLHEHKQNAPDALSRFLREAKISLTLQHPNIIQAYELGEQDGRMWLAMELLEGDTLSQHLERRAPLSVLEVLSIIGPLCGGLDEAHRRGVVHRDLKPGNIMLARTSQGVTPKLLDFGMASFREAATLTLSSLVSGTPKYMAPEQWNGLKHAEAPADIYALGVIFYFALSKRFPFEADSPMSWMKKHSVEPPLSLAVAMGERRLPDAATQAIMSALSKNPLERPSSAMQLFNELCGGLTSFVEGDPLQTQEAGIFDTVAEDSTETLSDLVIVRGTKK